MGWAPWHDWQFACTIVLISQGSEPSSFDCAGSPVEPDPPPGLHPAIATTANDRILSFRIWYSPNNNLQCRECNVHVGTERATSTFWINIFASGVTRAFSLDFLRDDIKPGKNHAVQRALTRSKRQRFRNAAPLLSSERGGSGGAIIKAPRAWEARGSRCSGRQTTFNAPIAFAAFALGPRSRMSPHGFCERQPLARPGALFALAGRLGGRQSGRRT
jgi:hypothetical protein